MEVSTSDRWTAATVYPDMWVDPDDDPRNNDGPSPDGELATYLDYLESYRFTLLMKCDGLDPEQLARRSVPPSTMSLLGLVRHWPRSSGTGADGWVTRSHPCAARTTTPTSSVRWPTPMSWRRASTTSSGSRRQPTR